ncbi:hypothetical protein A6V37_35500 [Paraburkholderia ginsengiterrae]|uniref:Peptidase M60 domain-containing protein n=1 Tax=Paraburkholderia ginsengiterrae TaxID=1462993 RepID=A0A1A9MYJ5_9BURK|nr:hypothetical protein A6V37_35500 [Paraburkholderia ginsengiterrae]
MSLSKVGDVWKVKSWQDAYLIEKYNGGVSFNLFESNRADGAPIGVYSVETGENAQWLLVPVDSVASSSESEQPREQSHIDAENRVYSIAPLPAASGEAIRAGNRKLADFQPSGLFVRTGETVKIELNAPKDMCVFIGPLWQSFSGGRTDNIVCLSASRGGGTFTSPSDGMMYFRYVSYAFEKTPGNAVVKVLAGGQRVPLYIAGQTTSAQWDNMLKSERSAPFVELVSDRTMITVKRGLYNRSGQVDPSSILSLTDRIRGLEDDISGLSPSKAPVDRPSPLRIHYLQDDFSTQREVEGVYMYATDYMVGMPDDSALDILEPAKLRSAWSIWHETGHVYQQDDWTPSFLVETTVNIYSLYVQSQMGYPSRLDEPGEDGPSSRQVAARYLKQANRDFSNENTFVPGHSAVWARLVMFERLRTVLGNDFYRNLHAYYRHNPLDDKDSTDDGKMNVFAYRSSLVSGFNLTEFFNRWGVRLTSQTTSKIRSLNLPQPSSKILDVI